MTLCHYGPVNSQREREEGRGASEAPVSPGSPAGLPTPCAPSRTALLLMPTLGLPRAPEGRGCPTRLCPQQRGGFAEHPASGTLEVPGRSGAALCLQHQLPLRGSPGRRVLAPVTRDSRQGAGCGAGVRRSPGGCGSPDRLRLGDPGGLPSRGPFAFQPPGPGAGSSPALGAIMSTGVAVTSRGHVCAVEKSHRGAGRSSCSANVETTARRGGGAHGQPRRHYLQTWGAIHLSSLSSGPPEGPRGVVAAQSSSRIQRPREASGGSSKGPAEVGQATC